MKVLIVISSETTLSLSLTLTKALALTLALTESLSSAIEPIGTSHGRSGELRIV